MDTPQIEHHLETFGTMHRTIEFAIGVKIFGRLTIILN